MGILSNIQPIESSGTTPFIRRSMIEQYVEHPLVKTAEIFYDKNIRTVSSSCNYKDEHGCSGIEIAYYQLSGENKKVAQKLAKKYPQFISIGEDGHYLPIPDDPNMKGELAVGINLPTEKFNSADELCAFFEMLASQFRLC